MLMKNNNRKSKEKLSLKNFIYTRILFVVALVCEVIALLMVKGVVQGDEQIINGLTLAGVLIMLIQLVIGGLISKYRHYSKKWGMGSYAEAPGSEAQPDSSQDGSNRSE